MERKRFKKGDVVRAYQKDIPKGREHKFSPFVVTEDTGLYVKAGGFVFARADWDIVKV